MKGRLKTSTEAIEFVSPPHQREPGYPAPAAPPADRAAFEALASMSDSALKELGLRKWGREHEHADGTESGRMLWLLPGEWYAAIPAGLPIVDIFFKKKTFKPGVTDDDIRFGCLSFGILRP